jgi:hypothetical protein
MSGEEIEALNDDEFIRHVAVVKNILTNEAKRQPF